MIIIIKSQNNSKNEIPCCFKKSKKAMSEGKQNSLPDMLK